MPRGSPPPPLLYRLPPPPLREPRGLPPRRIEPPRRCIPLAQPLHYVLECHRHVALHIGVGQVPARVLEQQLERPAPALAPGQVHHAAEQPPVGLAAEQRGRDDRIVAGSA